VQQGWFSSWLIFHDPFTFLTFFVYLTCAVASVNRAPFDLAEAESELVAGFLTEYSGFRWSLFFMAEYGSMVAVSGLAAILFFGGWNGPLPVTQWLGLNASHGAVAGWVGDLLGSLNFIFKAFFGVTVMMWLRWTLPRLRIDQVMTVCLKYCIPLSSAMFVGAVLWTYLFPGGLLLHSRLGEVGEGATVGQKARVPGIPESTGGAVSRKRKGDARTRPFTGVSAPAVLGPAFMPGFSRAVHNFHKTGPFTGLLDASGFSPFGRHEEEPRKRG
jgi:hypothetical protein